MTRDEWRRAEPVLAQAIAVPPERRQDVIDTAFFGQAIREELVNLLQRTSGLVPRAETVDAARTIGAGGGGAAADASPLLAAGESLADGRFSVVRQLGRGGMGEVYLAHDRTLSALVALKVVCEPQTREAQHARLCSGHPHIATLHDVFEARVADRPVTVLVMEYVVGRPANQIIDDGPVPLRDAVRWLRQVASALAHAHDRNVLHCDLKPANILIAPGEGAKVLDFGIGRATFERHSPHGLRGTAPYMAPEQLLEGRFSPAGDLYSAGVTLFEFLTGRLPFEADGPELFLQIAGEPAPPVSEYRAIVPPRLDEVVARALAKDPRDRFRSARAFERALEAVEWELVSDTSPIPVPMRDLVPPAPGAPQRANRAMTLEECLEHHGHFSAREASLIGTTLCRALAAIHHAGLVHGSVQTQHVVWDDGGNVALVDAGTTRPAAVRAAGLPPPPSAHYRPPEAAADAPATEADDLYGLGVTLYRLVTGAYPATSAVEAHPEAASVRDVRADLPAAFVQVVDRAIAVDPAVRYASAEAFEAALLRTLTSHGVAPSSIAVLPFANIGGDQDAEYFSDGLTEELIHALSHIEALRVVSRTSVFEFKGRAINIRRIGDQLGVANVLEGSVRRAGDRLRITVQLVSVADGCQIWGERFDRSMVDVFDVQDEIAKSIADRLAVTIGNQRLVKSGPHDLEAYHLYLKGRFHWNKRSSSGFERARQYFEAALGRDDRYAAAWAGLADYYISAASWGLLAPSVAWPQAEAAALRALEHDPSLGEAHVVLAAYRTYYQWNWAAGEREFRLARQFGPGDVNARVQYAAFLIQRGRAREAREEIERALTLDPLSATVNTGVAAIEYYARAYERALESCRHTLDLAPDDIEACCILGWILDARGQRAEAVGAFERARVLSDGNPLVLAALAAARARAGDAAAADAADAHFREIEATSYVPPIARAWVALAAGRLEAAFEWFHRAAAAHDPLLCYLPVAPLYDGIRDDPRAAAVLRTIGMAEVKPLGR